MWHIRFLVRRFKLFKQTLAVSKQSQICLNIEHIIAVTKADVMDNSVESLVHTNGSV